MIRAQAKWGSGPVCITLSWPWGHGSEHNAKSGSPLSPNATIQVVYYVGRPTNIRDTVCIEVLYQW